MSYRVRSTRIENGVYDLSYGKGSKKIECRITRSDVVLNLTGPVVSLRPTGRWLITKGNDLGISYSLTNKEDLKRRWGRQAYNAYVLGVKPVTPVIDASDSAGYARIQAASKLDKIIRTEWGSTRMDQNRLENLLGIYGSEFIIRKAKEWEAEHGQKNTTSTT